MRVLKKIPFFILLLVSMLDAKVEKAIFKPRGPIKISDVSNQDIFTISGLKKSSISYRNQTVCVSIPKCGTHLLLKCLTLFDIPGIRYNYAHDPSKTSAERLKRIRAKNELGPPHHDKGMFYFPEVGQVPKGLITKMNRANQSRLGFWSHWPYTKELAHFFKKKTRANFLIIRDPRAMVVSFARMVGTSRNGQKADLKLIIADLITGNQQYFVKWASEIQSAYPLLWELGLYKYYQMYLPWLQEKNFMLVKFEDLVGPAGGGSYHQQIRTIRAIASHMGCFITQPKLEEVMGRLFGGTGTFQEGQSSGWKKHFTPEIKELFQRDKQLMQLLVDLGYEKDFSW